MSIELQIQASVLGVLAVRAVQARLRATCFAPVGAAYIDHADVAAEAAEVLAAGSAVHLRIPIDVYVAPRAAVMAAPNAAPAGASTPAGRVGVTLELAAAGSAVSLRCVDADLGAMGAALGDAAAPAREAIIKAVDSPAAADLSAALTQLGMPSPSSARVELAGPVVAIRFEPAGSARSRLFGGHEWGLFLDGSAVERLASSRVPTGLQDRVPSLAIAAHWRPAGAVPHVDIDYRGKAQVPDPFAGDVDGTLGCDFSLTPTITKFLRTTVRWSLHINLGDLVPGFIDNMVEDRIAEAMDPARFGGTPVGKQAFYIDSPLPELAFGGARCVYATVMAAPEGMTLGGPVRLPLDPGKDTLQPSVHPFGLPYRLDICSILARTGSGAPRKTVTLDEVSTGGSVWMEGCGAFCDVEVVAPGSWITTYMSRPPSGTVDETQQIDVTVPSAMAQGINEPVRFIVRTARGVRLIDLGTPPDVELDANGHVTNAHVSYIDNCLYIPEGEHDAYGINWGRGHGLNQNMQPPPLETPDWQTYLGKASGLDVQIVSLHGLEPGELIQYRSRDHAVEVAADSSGRAVVPVLRPLSAQQEPASLIRVNRRGIAGHFEVQAAVLAGQASVPAAGPHRLDTAAGGGAVLTTRLRDQVSVHEIGRLNTVTLLRRETLDIPGAASAPPTHAASANLAGMAALNPQPLPPGVVGSLGRQRLSAGAAASLNPQPLPPGGEVSLNPQPLPPGSEVSLNPQPLPPGDPGRALHAALPGLVSLWRVPGFADAPVALARMADGSTLVVELRSQGGVRVAGTFRGPIGEMSGAGDWASAPAAGGVALYRVRRG